MEQDEYYSDMLPRNQDFNSIESSVQSMTLGNDDVEMLENSHGSGGLNISESNQAVELDEGSKAFLQLQKEREETAFSRTCLFCRKHFTGNRSLLLDHFTEQHNFFMGQPDNLVYINEFLDILENMLNKLKCIYCEKIFKDWSALKEHMRKKMHKRINPDNKIFDKFYMSNYLEMFDSSAFTPHEADEEREIEIEPKDDTILCLYCDSKFSDFDEIMNHLKDIHDFDFRQMKKLYQLNFYSQVKLINFIRHKVLANECTICDVQCTSKESLSRHMIVSQHVNLLPPKEKWDQSEYFFSTLDSDYFLCGLQDDDDIDSNIEVISEDIVFPKSSVLVDQNLREELL